VKNREYVPILLVILSIVILLFPPTSYADELTIPDWVFEKVGKFITDTHLDQYGRLWVGTEEDGVWLFDGTTKGKLGVKHFTTKDGLGDDYVYAVAVDKQGRTWVGHLNHGVSVYNGKEWKNYDVATGPLGERVFDIAVNPKNGNVWMATNAGLARYLPEKDKWDYFTRADGLPSDQVEAIAFNQEGVIYVGTQCDGLAIANAVSDDIKWHTIKGPDIMPFSPAGKGLPSSQINDVLVSKKGDVYVGTSSGLAISTDKGKNWTYVRGKNLKSKLQQIYCPENYTRLRKSVDKALSGLEEYKGILLLEDYVTCLGEDSKGNIWIGYRTAGYEIYDPQQGKIICSKSDKKYIFGIVVSGVEQPLFGCFSEGLKKADWPDETYLLELLIEKKTHEEFISLNAKFPSVATPPSTESLKKMMDKIESLPELEGQQAVYLGEDWTTQGDWVGRYGSGYGVLCATDSPFNHYVGWPDLGYAVMGNVGKHGEKNEGLRHWIHWMKTDDKRVLYNPVIGYRREAEWDDHGEVYSWNFDGPDIWIAIRVPVGMQKVTLYFINPNGHNSTEQNRDYIVEVKNYTDNLAKAHFAPALAKTRVRDFWGGVYKSFVVTGPNKYLIKIDRNYCFNTLISAVMFDQLKGPQPEIPRLFIPFMGDVVYNPPGWSMPKMATKDMMLTETLWNILDNAYDKEENHLIQRQYRVAAYRTALSEEAPRKLQEHWRWKLGIWKKEDRDKFDNKVAAAFKWQVEHNPHIFKDKEESEKEPWWRKYF